MMVEVSSRLLAGVYTGFGSGFAVGGYGFMVFFFEDRKENILLLHSTDWRDRNKVNRCNASNISNVDWYG